MVDSPAGNKKDKGKKKSAREYVADLGFAMELINSDPSLQEFIKRVRQYMDANKGRVPTKDELSRMKQGLDWFERYNALQEEARKQQADTRPGRRADFNESLRLSQQRVAELAREYGVTLTEDQLQTIALEARLDGLTDIDIRDRFGPILQQLVLVTGNLAGRAAEFEREILQWSRRNGLDLSGDMIARFVQAGAEGRSTLEDIKSDLRRTYLRGAYPAWADRIDQGDDPADFSRPYRQRIARLLEMNEDDIDLSDGLLQRGLQAMGDDGKPRMMPLWEFEKQVREDPRWQQTNNAYEAYAQMTDRVLSMFGFG